MLTAEQKYEIIKRNFDYMKPYIKRVLEEMPYLESATEIENIASCWELEEFSKERRVSVDTAILAYAKRD